MQNNFLLWMLIGFLFTQISKNSANLKAKINEKICKLSPTIEALSSSVDSYFNKINYLSNDFSESKINNKINDFIDQIEVENIKKLPDEIFNNIFPRGKK